MKEVNVAVGVVLRQSSTFVCLRSKDKHQGGKWEFPGGKVDPGETPLQALSRELEEEIGIVVSSAQALTQIRHDYGDKKVALHVFTVDEFDNEPFGKEGQVGKWLALNALSPSDFPEANVAIIEALKKHI